MIDKKMLQLLQKMKRGQIKKAKCKRMSRPRICKTFYECSCLKETLEPLLEVEVAAEETL